MGIGVDFGTSNSAAAVFDGDKVRIVPVESTGKTMPSASYIDRQFQVVTGQEAIDRYIAENAGRKVELSAELLGEGRTSTGQIGEGGLPEKADSHLIYGASVVDAGEKGRLFRGVKRMLGSTGSQRLMVFDRPFRLVALITPIILRMQKAVAQLLKDEGSDAPSDHACIGHPVNFEGKEANHNTVALERLCESFQYAGFVEQALYPEPLAAALSFMHAYPNLQAQTLLAVDFGGGTLDLCILNSKGDAFDVVAIHGVGLGGDHIDQALFRELLFPLLGKGESWTRKGEDRQIETLFPFEEYEDLILNWAISYMLNQNEYTTPVLDRLRQGDAGALKFNRLYALIKHNYSYLVFQAIKDLKAKLSDDEQAVLDIPEIDVELTLSRAQFEKIIAKQLAMFESAVNDTLAKSQLGPDDIDVVVSTGGSSLIPAVRRSLENTFPGKVLDHDPFTSVAEGLAIAEYRGLSFKSDA
ncbi:MAG: Hsp70 family protein [Pseudohongiellaceae bacterium]|nr:Hsp70 family protein [Pseudohongiellaceae bacterium]